MNENFTERPLRPDAKKYRWMRTNALEPKAWWGQFHEFRGNRAAPPMRKLTDDPHMPDEELYKIWKVKRNEVALELNQGEIKNFSLATMTKGYLKYKLTEGVKQSYHIYIMRSLRYLMDACGNFDMRNWDASKEEEFLQFINERGVRGTAHHRHVQSFLNWIHNKRIIPGFHYWRVTKKKEADHEIQIFTESEIIRYKEKIDNHPNQTWKRVWYLAYYAMMREGEIWSMRTQNIYLNTKRPYIEITNVPEIQTDMHPDGWTPKAHIKRKIGIHKDLAEFLKKDLNNNPRFWYLDRTTKRALKYPPESMERLAFSDPRGISRGFQRLRDEQFKWGRKIDFVQALRRTTITRHVEAGTSIENLCYLVGHRDERTTRKYYIWVDKNKALDVVNIDL